MGRCSCMCVGVDPRPYRCVGDYGYYGIEHLSRRQGLSAGGCKVGTACVGGWREGGKGGRERSHLISGRTTRIALDQCESTSVRPRVQKDSSGVLDTRGCWQACVDLSEHPRVHPTSIPTSTPRPPPIHPLAYPPTAWPRCEPGLATPQLLGADTATRIPPQRDCTQHKHTAVPCHVDPL